MGNSSDDRRFIDPHRINALLEAARSIRQRDGCDSYEARIREILAKAREAKGLSPSEAAILLTASEPELRDEIRSAAGSVKERIYGKRIVLFAPLYLSDYCVNGCRYCGYKAANGTGRTRLTAGEIKAEVRALITAGHKRLALEFGEDPVNCPMEYVEEAIGAIYSESAQNGEIRRVNVNLAATVEDDYRRLKAAGIGTYILFQETYNPDAYAWAHPSGPKSDYLWHLTAMDRAMAAGIDDVGLGVLFGLYDWQFEVLGLLLHAEHLEEAFGVGPHTISVPRLRTAVGMDLRDFPHLMGEEDLLHTITVLRLAVPYTGLILSTRERPEFRSRAISCGISQISAGSCTGVGGYSKTKEGSQAQFRVDDHRSPDEVVRNLCESGHIPSYCTACYRMRRTGERFMELAKTGRIQNVCLPNALLTFKEYIEDYASPATRSIGDERIRDLLGDITDDDVRRQTEAWLEQISGGQRDFFF